MIASILARNDIKYIEYLRRSIKDYEEMKLL
jgi:hypothetical protein